MAVLATSPWQLACDLRAQGAIHTLSSHTVGGLRSNSVHSAAAPRTSFDELRAESKRGRLVRAKASSTDLAGAADWGEPVSLGTVKLPPDVNLQRLEVLIYQWGSNLTQNANLPLPVPIKVDKIDGGVRLGYIRLMDGAIEDLAHIDCVVYPGTRDSSAMFRAVRNGRLKNEVPPGEPVIMQSLLQALKKSIELSRV